MPKRRRSGRLTGLCLVYAVALAGCCSGVERYVVLSGTEEASPSQNQQMPEASVEDGPDSVTPNGVGAGADMGEFEADQGQQLGSAPEVSRQPQQPRGAGQATSPSSSRGARAEDRSSDPILIGLMNSSDAGRVIESLAGGTTEPDWAQVAAPLIAYANDNGGIGGRPLEPVWAEVSSTSRPQVMSQRACASWTEDRRVTIAVPNNPLQDDDILRACLGQAGVLAVSPMSYARTMDRQLQENRLWFELETLSLESFARVYVQGLTNQGYFEDAKVGLIHDEGRAYTTVVDTVLLPELRRAGVQQVERAAMSVRGVSDLGPASQQASNIILRFRAAGVRHVMFFEPWVGWVMFAQQAEQQNYRPLYGLSTQSNLESAIETGLVPPRQLVGARAVGWNPAVDVPTADEGMWSRKKDCIDLYERAGLQAQMRSSHNSYHKMLGLCETIMLLMEAGQRGSGEVTPARLAEDLRTMGEVELANLPRARFGPERQYGAMEWRPAAYNNACECFRYTGDRTRF